MSSSPTVAFRVPPELLEDIERSAAESKRTVSNWLRFVASQHVTPSSNGNGQRDRQQVSA